MKSWKTTASGVAMILTALGTALEALASGKPVHWDVTGMAFMTGIGLICAKDHNVTGGTKPQ